MNEKLFRNLQIIFVFAMENEIIELLQQGMKSLKRKCELFSSLIDSGDVFNTIISETYKDYLETAKAVIKQSISQLEVHLRLDDISLGDVNFYRVFSTPFLTGSYHKGVEFYIKEIHNDEEGDEVLITNQDVLDKEFTIHHCMSCMNLVPQQLAGNAKKYSVGDLLVKVLLVKDVDYNTNTIFVSNLGPHCSNDEINRIVADGISGNEIRGKNAQNIAGMGIGLSEVKDIVGLHNSILDTSFDISTDNKIVTKIGDMDYSFFTIIISYSTKPNADTLIPFSKKFKERIPVILLHNSVDIIANLIEGTKLIRKIRFKGNDSILKEVDKFKIEINKFQDLTKLCLFMRNSLSTKNLLGNPCEINLGDKIEELIGSICDNDYPHLDNGNTISMEGETNNSMVYSSIYPCLYGIMDFLLCQISPDSNFHIDCCPYSLTIECEDIDFDDFIVKHIPDGWERQCDYEKIRLKMYYDVMLENGFTMNTINNHKLEISIRESFEK